MQELMAQAHSFAACVRVEFTLIERAIQAGVPLAVITRSICETHNVSGSVAALKSALARIRKAREGWKAHQYMEQNDPTKAQRPDLGASNQNRISVGPTPPTPSRSAPGEILHTAMGATHSPLSANNDHQFMLHAPMSGQRSSRPTVPIPMVSNANYCTLI